jgi:hypothetical protein
MGKLLAGLFALPALFFAYYTARLFYINIVVAGVAQHRQFGMYIGFVAFPTAVVVFGWLSLKCWRRSS